MMDTKLLVVDDDTNISELLKIYFEKEGYDVRTAGDGAEAVNTFKMFDPDMVLLDIMLPKKDGWQVCREIREMSSTPVIMITAKGEIFDKVLGLELGADDFVVKPFDMKELSARVKAVLRRYQSNASQGGEDGTIKFDNIEISKQKYELKIIEDLYVLLISFVCQHGFCTFFSFVLFIVTRLNKKSKCLLCSLKIILFREQSALLMQRRFYQKKQHALCLQT